MPFKTLVFVSHLLLKGLEVKGGYVRICEEPFLCGMEVHPVLPARLRRRLSLKSALTDLLHAFYPPLTHRPARPCRLYLEPKGLFQ